MMQTKVCSKCKQELCLTLFSKNKQGKDGLRSECKLCQKKYREENKEKRSEYRKKYYEGNREKVLESRKKYRQENKEKFSEYIKKYLQEKKEKVLESRKKYRQENKEKFSEYMKKYREENKGKISARKKKYRQENKEKVLFFTRKRQSQKLKRIPIWLLNEDFWLIEEVYKLRKIRSEATKTEWHVDHIIPLQGKNVSGLHCPDNLQLIPRVYNLSKFNKWDWDMQR